MLRYLAIGAKDLTTHPVHPTSRFNWEFYANLSGPLRPTLPDQRTTVAARPTLWLFPPDAVHGWDAPGPVERVVLHFSSVPDVLRETCARERIVCTKLSPTDVTTLRTLARTLEPHLRKTTAESLLWFDRALIDLSLIMLRGRQLGTQLPLETVAVERAERAVEWFNARIEQRPTLSAVAAAVHVSPAHLRRQFRLVFGKAPHAVFTRLRLEKAAQLLATTTAKLDVIARQTGFSSASDFCRVFHRCFKVYPNVWRTYLSGIEQNDRDLQLQRLLARTGTASLRSTPDETSGGSEEEAVAHAPAPAAPAPRKRASA